MSPFLKNAFEILSQGVHHFWKEARHRIRPKSASEEVAGEGAQAHATRQPPTRFGRRKVLFTLLTTVLVVVCLVVFQYRLTPATEPPVNEAISDTSGSPWLVQYKDGLNALRQGTGAVDFGSLAAAAPNDPVSQLLLDRMRATAKYQTGLNFTGLPADVLKIDWTAQNVEAMDALAWCLREAIEQAMESGQWRAAENIADGIAQTGLLSSGKLSGYTEAALRVASGRAWLRLHTETQKENTRILSLWIDSVKDQKPGPALWDAQTFLSELEIRAGMYTQARKRLESLTVAVFSEDGKRGGYSNYSEPHLAARVAGALLLVGEFEQARKLLDPYTAIDSVEQHCLRSMDAFLVAAEVAIEKAEFVKAEGHYHQVKACLDKHPGFFKEARMQNGLGILYTQIGRLDDAAIALGNASKIWGEALPSDHEWIGSLHNNSGALQRVNGHFDEARTEYDAAAEVWRAALGEAHPAMATYYNNIAELGMLSKQLGEVKNALNTALRLRHEAFGDEHPWTALVVSNMGEYLAMLGQTDAALNNHRIALAIREKSLGRDHADTAMSLNNLGSVLFTKQEYRQSLESFTRAVAVNKALYGEAHPQTLLTKLNLAVNGMALGDYASAEMWLKQIVEGQEAGAPLSALQVNARAKLGDTQFALNNLAEAQVQYELVLESVTEDDRVSLKTSVAAAYNGLSHIYKRQNNASAAKALAKKYPWAQS